MDKQVQSKTNYQSTHKKGEVEHNINQIFSDKKNILTIESLLEQIKVLENEKKELALENEMLHQKLLEKGESEANGNGNSKKGKKTLFERLGADKLKEAVQLQYDLMLQHDDIGTQFHTMAYYCPESFQRLKEHQVQFMTGLFGGPNIYTGRNIKQAHKFKGLQEDDLNVWLACVEEAYTKLGIDQDIIDESIELLTSVKDLIVQK